MGQDQSKSVLGLQENNLGFPPEVAEKFGEYLSWQDKLVCRRVCKEWNSLITTGSKAVSPHVSFLVTVPGYDLNQLASSHLAGNWTRFIFRSVQFGKGSYQAFWNKYEDFITELEFEQCYFFPHLRHNSAICSNLMHLKLNQCGEAFMMGAEIFRLPEWICLENLSSLDLSGNPRYLSDRILFTLLRPIKALRSLNLSGCGMCFMKGIFRRYYPTLNEENAGDSELSDNVLTFQVLRLGFLSTEKAAFLNELIMDSTNIDGSALESISDPSNYHWESLSVNSCREVKFEALKMFLQRQPLKKFQMSSCPYSAGRIDELLAFLKSVEVLNLTGSMLTSVAPLQDLKKLKHLEIGDSPIKFKTEGRYLANLTNLKYLIAGSITEFMTESFAQIPVIPDVLVDLLGTLSNLTELNLAKGKKSVTDEVVQVVIHKIRGLRLLNLEDCAVTDLGLTGQLLDKFSDTDSPEVLKQKREKLQAWQAKSIYGLPLSTLQNLRVLNLQDCKLLGEATWQIGLNLPYLENLQLSGTTISQSGLLTVLSNCRSLVSLSIKHDLLREETLQRFLSLPRLRRDVRSVYAAV